MALSRAPLILEETPCEAPPVIAPSAASVATSLPSTLPLSTSWPTVLDAVLVAAPTAALTAIFPAKVVPMDIPKVRPATPPSIAPRAAAPSTSLPDSPDKKGDASVYRRADNGADNHPADDLSVLVHVNGRIAGAVGIRGQVTVALRHRIHGEEASEGGVVHAGAEVVEAEGVGCVQLVAEEAVRLRGAGPRQLHASGLAADLERAACDGHASFHGMRLGVAGHPAAGVGHAVRIIVVHLHDLAVRPGDDPDAAEMVAQEEQVLRAGAVHGDQAAVEQDVLQGVVRAHQIAAVLGPGQGPVLPEGCSFPLCAVREIGERLSPAGVLDPHGPVLPVVGDAGDPPVQVGGHVAVPVIGILHCHGGPVAEVRRARHRGGRCRVRHGR